MKALGEEAGLEPILIQCENVEPTPSPVGYRAFRGKQALKAIFGREPFLNPLLPALNGTLDTIAIARKP